MKKIIIAVIIAIFSFSVVNAGFDCEPVLKDNTYKTINNKVDKIYEKVNKFSVEKKSKFFIKIQEMLNSGGKISLLMDNIRKKYGNNSKEYKKVDVIYERIYCDNQKGYNELIENFFTNFESVKKSIKGKKVIREYYDSEVFNDKKNINLNKKTFIVLKLEDNKGISVDKNFLYFYKKGWPEDVKNIIKIKDYKSFKIYDGMLVGDDSFFLNGNKITNINLKTFKRINKKTVAYRENGKNVEDYFYYEDEAYFYHKRMNLEKIGIKSKKLEILSKKVYKYNNKIYFDGKLVLDKNIDNFKLVNKLLGDKDLMLNLEIFGRDDKYIYINIITYGEYYFGKLEFDYDSFEKVKGKHGEIIFKDKYNTFEYSDGKIIKIK